MYAKLLRQVRDSLTPENWFKGDYFSINKNKLCMCVHGAAQALVNPQVKIALSGKGAAAALASALARTELDAPADAVDHFSKTKSLHETWKYRHEYSKYVNKDYICHNKNYGNNNLYWLMGMLGITASFNDHPNTTLEMLKEKLTLAAKWAEENEEFLLNN